ncbi:hypothetical protein QJQ45_018340, partial [Haematococcus lacustris]
MAAMPGHAPIDGCGLVGRTECGRVKHRRHPANSSYISRRCPQENAVAAGMEAAKTLQLAASLAMPIAQSTVGFLAALAASGLAEALQQGSTLQTHLQDIISSQLVNRDRLAIAVAPGGLVQLLWPADVQDIVTLGLDFLDVPWRNSSFLAATTSAPAYLGPFTLRAGMPTSVLLSPVYVDNSSRVPQRLKQGSLLPGPLTTRNCTAPCTKTYLWGFVAVTHAAPFNVSSPANLVNNYLYKVVRPAATLDLLTPEAMLTAATSGPACGQVLVAASASLPANPVRVEVQLPNTQWCIEVEPLLGWRPRWLDPVLAVVVLLGIMLWGLASAVLVSRRMSQRMLQAMVPASLIKQMEQSHDLTAQPATIMGGTMAEKMLSMMSELLDGRIPGTQDLLHIRTALLQANDIYQPVGLAEQMAVSQFDEDVALNLMQQLGGRPVGLSSWGNHFFGGGTGFRANTSLYATSAVEAPSVLHHSMARQPTAQRRASYHLRHLHDSMGHRPAGGRYTLASEPDGPDFNSVQGALLALMDSAQENVQEQHKHDPELVTSLRPTASRLGTNAHPAPLDTHVAAATAANASTASGISTEAGEDQAQAGSSPGCPSPTTASQPGTLQGIGQEGCAALPDPPHRKLVTFNSLPIKAAGRTKTQSYAEPCTKGDIHGMAGKTTIKAYLHEEPTAHVPMQVAASEQQAASCLGPEPCSSPSQCNHPQQAGADHAMGSHAPSYTSLAQTDSTTVFSHVTSSSSGRMGAAGLGRVKGNKSLTRLSRVSTPDLTQPQQLDDDWEPLPDPPSPLLPSSSPSSPAPPHPSPCPSSPPLYPRSSSRGCVRSCGTSPGSMALGPGSKHPAAGRVARHIPDAEISWDLSKADAALGPDGPSSDPNNTSPVLQPDVMLNLGQLAPGPGSSSPLKSASPHLHLDRHCDGPAAVPLSPRLGDRWKSATDFLLGHGAARARRGSTGGRSLRVALLPSRQQIDAPDSTVAH